MTTDTIDALWRAVEQFPDTGRDWSGPDGTRAEQHAVLGRLLDAYLDVGMDREAEAIRRIITAAPLPGGSPFVIFWGRGGNWHLQGAGEVFGEAAFADMPYPHASARGVFEAFIEVERKHERHD